MGDTQFPISLFQNFAIFLQFFHSAKNKILLVCSNKNDVQRSSIALYSISFFQKNPFHGFFTSISRFSSLRKKNLRKNFFLRENWIKNSDENTKNEKFANKTSHGKSRILYKKGKLIKIRWIISSVKVHTEFP